MSQALVRCGPTKTEHATAAASCALFLIGGCEFRRFLNYLYYSPYLDFPAWAAHASRELFPDEQHDKKPRHDTDSSATLWAGVHRIYLPAPLDAQARAEMQIGLSPRLQSDPVGTLHGPTMARSIRHSSPASGIWQSKTTSISAFCMAMAPTPSRRKGAMASAIPATNTRRARRSSRSSRTTALYWPRFRWRR